MCFVVENRRRLMMDLDDQQTVGQVKEEIRQILRLDPDDDLVGIDSHQRKILSLSYAGAILDESWRMYDLGIQPRAQVQCCQS